MAVLTWTESQQYNFVSKLITTWGECAVVREKGSDPYTDTLFTPHTPVMHVKSIIYTYIRRFSVNRVCGPRSQRQGPHKQGAERGERGRRRGSGMKERERSLENQTNVYYVYDVYPVTF